MSEDPADLRMAVRLHVAPLTPRQRTALVRHAGGLPALAELAAGAGGDAPWPWPTLDALRSVGEDAVEAELSRSVRRGVRVITRAHPCWPPLLNEIPDPPLALWVRGELPDPGPPALSIVGSRRPTPYGIHVAAQLAEAIASQGGLVVSGGARGVDTEAHRAALGAGGPTVALLGCGADVAYPRENAGLFAAIARRGAVVSELPCGSPPLRHHFPIRNRLLAGWSRSVIVVEAAPRSGSLITAGLALDQGRDVVAVPGPVTSSASQGTNKLIASGARALLRVDGVLEDLRPDELAALRPRKPVAHGGGGAPAPDAVLDALRPGEARAVDELAGRTGMPASDLLAALSGLEVAGRVRSLPGGLWMREPRARPVP